MEKCIVRFCACGTNAQLFYTENGRTAKVFSSVKEAKETMWQLKCCGHKNVHHIIVG